MITFVLVFCAVIFLLVYIIGKNNEIYWKKRKVAFYSKNRITGYLWDFLTKDKPLFETLFEIYKEYRNKPAVGIGSFSSPKLYVIDATNVEHILATDFNSFNHRGVVTNNNDLLADNVLFMNGNRWKLMRQNMTPLFTPTKLKAMYYIVDKSAADFIKHFKKNPELLKGKAFNTLSTFSCAAIGAAVFGVTTKSIFDSPFLVMAQKTFNSTFFKNIKFAILILSSTLFKFLGIKLFHEHEKFFISAIKQVLRERESLNVKKHDFIDLCLKLKTAGKLIDKETCFEIKITDELLAAQAFFFFVGGVKPTASAMFATLVELGKNPEYLERLHNEIDETFEKFNNVITYDTVINMKFLDMSLSEALRMHPPISNLLRKCVRDTVLPVGNIKVDRGTVITMPLFERHHDVKYYKDPETYNPERFSQENRHKIKNFTYVPFGKGNRECIGARYALLQAKAGLIHLLRNFTIKTVIKEGGIKYRREQIQVKFDNVDLEFLPRNINV